MEHRVARLRGHGTLASAAVGAALGGVWGIVARAWMRLISETPEFSWSGTMFIVLVPTVAGALLGFAAARRRRGRARVARTAAGFATLFLGVGAGTLMLPTILLGGLALSRRHFPLWMRLTAALGVLGMRFLLVGVESGSGGQLATALAVGVVAGVVVVGWKSQAVMGACALFAAASVIAVILIDTALPWWRLALGAIAYVPLVLVPTWAMTTVFRPSRYRPGPSAGQLPDAGPSGALRP
jgi:hypothetical protein